MVHSVWIDECVLTSMYDTHSVWIDECVLTSVYGTQRLG